MDSISTEAAKALHPFDGPWNPFACFDCDGTAPEYMVHDSVWYKAIPEYGRIKMALRLQYAELGDGHKSVCLCLRCLERRLGRPLILDDFIPGLPINDPVFLGYRMAREFGRESGRSSRVDAPSSTP